MGDLNAVQNTLCRRDLIRTHDYEHLFGGKYAVPRQDVQQGVFRKEGFREVNQVRDGLVVCIGPERCKFKAVAGFPFLDTAGGRFFYRVESGAVGVVFGIRAVGDNENLHILKSR